MGSRKGTNQTQGQPEAKEEIPVEEAFEALSNIIDRLDQPEVTLEESLELYRKGVRLLVECEKTLGGLEREMILLTEEGELADGRNE